MFSQTNKIMKERRKIGMLGKTAKGKQAEDKETEYASYEICRKSKVGENKKRILRKGRSFL